MVSVEAFEDVAQFVIFPTDMAVCSGVTGAGVTSAPNVHHDREVRVCLRGVQGPARVELKGRTPVGSGGGAPKRLQYKIIRPSKIGSESSTDQFLFRFSFVKFDVNY